MKRIPDHPLDISRLARLRNKGRSIIFETLYGSKLYGTALPDSDTDIRGVYLPGLYDFLLQGDGGVTPLEPEGDFPETDDNQYFPASLFVAHLLGMKVTAVEIFFAAKQARQSGTVMHPAMDLILDHESVLIHADPNGFIGHARQKAARHIAGDDPRNTTLDANKHVLARMDDALAADPDSAGKKLRDIRGLVEDIATHDAISRTTSKDGLPTLMINARQMLETERLGTAIEIVRARVERFRRKADTVNEPRKFKDLATALRMTETIRDLMLHGDIRFPLRNADHHVRIRRGEIAQQRIVAEIDAAQTEVETLITTGSQVLPEKPSEHLKSATRQDLTARLNHIALTSLDF